jgi:hypothetical protein
MYTGGSGFRQRARFLRDEDSSNRKIRPVYGRVAFQFFPSGESTEKIVSS